mmetsp:Transcript_14657/g.33699  ORF Transcript_14657/g.33699 Transcript_14657/m.33699 type:complete len:208 (+) Transcript_14657:92-715(+)
MPSGRAATPTAERADLPAGPNTSMKRWLTALMAIGCFWKSGDEATKPFTFTTLLIRSRDPSWFSSVASMVSPHALAASTASSSVAVAPAIPQQRLPSGLRGTWPDTWACASPPTGAPASNIGWYTPKGFLGKRPSRTRPSCLTRSLGFPSGCSSLAKLSSCSLAMCGSLERSAVEDMTMPVDLLPLPLPLPMAPPRPTPTFPLRTPG